MPDVTIVFWRDIPAQVKVGRGRSAAKAALPERFEQAIDRCAMRVRATDADAYTEAFRSADPYPVEGAPDAVALAEAQRIDAEYGQERLALLVENAGWEAR